MIPKKVNIAGIEHKVIEEDRTRLQLALKKIGVENWRNRFSYWDPVDARIYLDRDLREELKELLFCIETIRAWTFFVGGKLGEEEEEIRPYATQLRLLLRSVVDSSKGRKTEGKNRGEGEEGARYIQ